MAILNITYNGLSVDYKTTVNDRMGDRDIRRTAVELIRSGELPGLHIAHLPDDAFDLYVVDRLRSARGPGGARIYLRPKVPFGRV
ncbi:MAG: hypothetical protein JKY37_01910 [Nannocystaceae bacterium]|nr:hypothetical protein [Nannocystaceae bacterium]